MRKIEMFRYSISGSFGYWCYCDNVEMFRIGAAVMPNNPVSIKAPGITLHSEKYLWRQPKGILSNNSNIREEQSDDWQPTNDRVVKNEREEVVAELHHKGKYFLLKYQNQEIIITAKNKQYVFSVNDRQIAYMKRPNTTLVPLHLQQRYSSYDWINAFELLVDEISDELVCLIAAFPMLKFDYQQNL